MGCWPCPCSQVFAVVAQTRDNFDLGPMLLTECLFPAHGCLGTQPLKNRCKKTSAGCMALPPLQGVRARLATQPGLKLEVHEHPYDLGDLCANLHEVRGDLPQLHNCGLRTHAKADGMRKWPQLVARLLLMTQSRTLMRRSWATMLPPG